MKHLFIGLSVSAALSLSACQSGNNGDQQATSKQETTSETPAAEAHHGSQDPTQMMPPTVKEAVLSIPAFKFYKVKSGIGFTNEDITPGRNTVFVLFDPNCGHCQQEAGHMAKNYDKLKDINIYFVSMNDPALMTTFLDTFGKELSGKANVEVLYDRNQEFIQRFHIPKQFPANYVYGADGQLKTYWEGDKPVDFLIEGFTK